MAPREDLLELWLQQRKEKSAPEPVAPPKNEAAMPEPEVPAARIPSPSLSGKLADFLSQKERREIENESYDGDSRPWTVEDVGSKSAIAVSLVLASHLVRFAGTTLDEQKLMAARDSIMHLFGPRDAVKIEVEAYELLSWFAGAIDPEWRGEDAEMPMQGETSEVALLRIIDDAIQNHHDLMMRYYTSSRGAFSERRITPLDVTAEKYLVAFCHTRQEKRVFRLTRIVRLFPVDENEVPIEDGLCYPNAADTRIPALPKVSLEAAVGAGDGKAKAKGRVRGADAQKGETPKPPPRNARKGKSADKPANVSETAKKKPSGKSAEKSANGSETAKKKPSGKSAEKSANGSETAKKKPSGKPGIQLSLFGD